MADETKKWLAGISLTVLGILSGIMWWAAQTDAAVKTNQNNVTRLEIQVERILEKLEEIAFKIVRMEDNDAIDGKKILEELGELNRRLNLNADADNRRRNIE